MTTTPPPPQPPLNTTKTLLKQTPPITTFPILTNYYPKVKNTTPTQIQIISSTPITQSKKKKTPNSSISLYSKSSSGYMSTSSPVPTTSVLDVIDARSSFTLNERLNKVVLEFKSLKEPVDRVRRLLDYAARLPKLEGSARVEENRVAGCTTQVWVEAEVEEGSGKVRFRGDSDSEITKGFVSCLIWVFDGAEAAEVAAVQAEEMEAVNVNGGGYGKEKSRVNTWLNVLLAMQDRTKALVAQRNERRAVTEAEAGVVVAPLASLVVSNGSYIDSQLGVQQPRWKQLDANLLPSK